MKPYRSLLFVPGHKDAWVEKAVRAGAHALILDLEDAVPEDLKESARDTVAKSIAWLAAEHPRVGAVVRVNPLDSEHFARDVAAAVRPGLSALLLPKLYHRDDVVRFDALVSAAEIERGLPRGSVALIPSFETARGLANVQEIADASPRVGSLMAAAARDGDAARELGFTWTAQGEETLYMRSKVVSAARAAGVRHVVLGLWQEISDLDGLRDFAESNRRIGYGGQVIIHPSHAPVVNEVYSPSQTELDRYRRLVSAYEQAAASGSGAVLFEGEHVDLAHVEHATDVLEQQAREKEGDRL
ncbi:CoA ester lyase [Saccharopolyspora erythraea]|uniref:HpcH/HpaI aldolase/citrate lyase family protein n=1 Tax=Saccharopolyspora erythraea TaxID=1836 RepID=UPI001BA76921|nr:CoA ester lyase [Saccharopolyspora erythraea]QUH01809.1 CoA ester lyase [Saccharopolyspora erythraea]